MSVIRGLVYVYFASVTIRRFLDLMSKIIASVVIIVLPNTANAGVKYTTMQSHESYIAAVHSGYSTAPQYIYITLTPAVGEPKSLCLSANSLVGAFYAENNLGRGETAKSFEILKSNTTHNFRFTNDRALEILDRSITYNEEDFNFIRNELATYSNAELRSGFSTYGELHAIYRGKGKKRRAYLDATGCYLVQRGIAAGLTDVSFQIYLP